MRSSRCAALLLAVATCSLLLCEALEYKVVLARYDSSVNTICVGSDYHLANLKAKYPYSDYFADASDDAASLQSDASQVCNTVLDAPTNARYMYIGDFDDLKDTHSCSSSLDTKIYNADSDTFFTLDALPAAAEWTSWIATVWDPQVRKCNYATSKDVLYDPAGPVPWLIADYGSEQQQWVVSNNLTGPDLNISFGVQTPKVRTTYANLTLDTQAMMEAYFKMVMSNLDISPARGPYKADGRVYAAAIMDEHSGGVSYLLYRIAPLSRCTCTAPPDGCTCGEDCDCTAKGCWFNVSDPLTQRCIVADVFEAAFDLSDVVFEDYEAWAVELGQSRRRRLLSVNPGFSFTASQFRRASNGQVRDEAIEQLGGSLKPPFARNRRALPRRKLSSGRIQRRRLAPARAVVSNAGSATTSCSLAYPYPPGCRLGGPNYPGCALKCGVR